MDRRLTLSFGGLPDLSHGLRTGVRPDGDQGQDLNEKGRARRAKASSERARFGSAASGGSTIVFVLTTSDNEQDRKLAFETNVAGYLLKSNSTDEFEKNMQLICDYVRRSVFPPSAIAQSTGL